MTRPAPEPATRIVVFRDNDLELADWVRGEVYTAYETTHDPDGIVNWTGRRIRVGTGWTAKQALRRGLRTIARRDPVLTHNLTPPEDH